jgi:hypothetical protein
VIIALLTGSPGLVRASVIRAARNAKAIAVPPQMRFGGSGGTSIGRIFLHQQWSITPTACQCHDAGGS